MTGGGTDVGPDDPHDDPGADGRTTPPRDEGAGLRRKAAKALFAFDPAELQELRDILGDLSRGLAALQHEMELLRDRRTPSMERRLDGIERTLGVLQEELAVLRDRRVTGGERRLDRLERDLAGVVEDLADLRDERLPAAVERMDVLVDRLAGELEEVASLTERSLLREPLPLPRASAGEERLADALGTLQPALLEAFRGDRAEISHRLERHLPLLREHAPVLDLGCGRGELLALLAEAGVEAAGIEGDAALATAARRRGLPVVEGDVLQVLAGEPAGSRGAVTAIHLLEHLDPASILALLAQVRRVLRPGGLFLAECPNPHTLRVGASLFWTDPTHVRPLLPETLEVLLRVSGFAVRSTEYLHPFPDGQRLHSAGDGGGSGDELQQRLARLERRLDELLNGPRDFVVTAFRNEEAS